MSKTVNRGVPGAASIALQRTMPGARRGAERQAARAGFARRRLRPCGGTGARRAALLRRLRRTARRPRHRRRLRAAAQPVAFRVFGVRARSRQACAVREAAVPGFRRHRGAVRGPRPLRPPHRERLRLSRSSAVGQARPADRQRRHRRGALGARHAGQAVSRSGRHPQRSGPGRRRAVRPRLLRRQRLQPDLGAPAGAGGRRARSRPGVRHRPAVERAARLRRPAGGVHRRHPGRPGGLGHAQQLSPLGSTGWLRFDFPFAQARPTACRIELGDAGSVGALPTATFEFAPANQYLLQVERFSRLLLGEPGVPHWPIEDALGTLRTIEALFASEHSGGWQAVRS